MARNKNVLRIVKEKDKLNDRVDEINLKDTSSNISAVIKDLKDTLITMTNVEALAAPQIGYPCRVFCLKFAHNDIRTFINPMITKVKGSTLSRESNPSIPDKEFIMPRAEEIQAAYQKPTGLAEENIFKGRAAAIFQQMVELLDGVMIDDYGLEILDGFDEASDEEKKEIIDMYIKSINRDLDAVNKDIEADPVLTKVKENMEFLTSVALGETDLLSYTKDKDIIESLKKESPTDESRL